MKNNVKYLINILKYWLHVEKIDLTQETGADRKVTLKKGERPGLGEPWAPHLGSQHGRDGAAEGAPSVGRAGPQDRAAAWGPQAS